MQRQNVTIRSRSPLGGKQTIHMKSKGYGGPIGSPVVGAPLGGYPGEFLETTVAYPPMAAGPGLNPPPLPFGYAEPGVVTTTTYPTMGGIPPTMGAVMPNNNRWKVTMKSRGNQPPIGLPAGTVAPYYSGNEGFDYKVRQRSGGLFSRGPKSTVHIKERNRGAGAYYGGSVMPGYSTVASPMMPPLYEEEVVQQYPYAAGPYGAGPYGAGPYGG